MSRIDVNWLTPEREKLLQKCGIPESDYKNHSKSDVVEITCRTCGTSRYVSIHAIIYGRVNMNTCYECWKHDENRMGNLRTYGYNFEDVKNKHIFDKMPYECPTCHTKYNVKIIEMTKKPLPNKCNECWKYDKHNLQILKQYGLSFEDIKNCTLHSKIRCICPNCGETMEQRIYSLLYQNYQMCNNCWKHDEKNIEKFKILGITQKSLNGKKQSDRIYCAIDGKIRILRHIIKNPLSKRVIKTFNKQNNNC